MATDCFSSSQTPQNVQLEQEDVQHYTLSKTLTAFEISTSLHITAASPLRTARNVDRKKRRATPSHQSYPGTIHVLCVGLQWLKAAVLLEPFGRCTTSELLPELSEGRVKPTGEGGGDRVKMRNFLENSHCLRPQIVTVDA